MQRCLTLAALRKFVRRTNGKRCGEKACIRSKNLRVFCQGSSVAVPYSLEITPSILRGCVSQCKLIHHFKIDTSSISATDVDDGSNGRAVYSLSSAQGKFQINGSTGEVTTSGHIDREVQGLYQLEIVATDQGSPPLISMTTLTINITDLNDNPPVFSRAEYQFTTAENFPPAAIGTIFANDSDLGINAEISYSLINASPFFMSEVLRSLIL